MALDGAFLHTIKNEIEEKALGSRIDRIYEPSRRKSACCCVPAAGRASC